MIQSNSFDDYVRQYNIKILNHFDPELQLINAKRVIKNKAKDLFGYEEEINSFLRIRNKNRKINNDKSMHKIFHSIAKIIVNDSDIGKNSDL